MKSEIIYTYQKAFFRRLINGISLNKYENTGKHSCGGMDTFTVRAPRAKTYVHLFSRGPPQSTEFVP